MPLGDSLSVYFDDVFFGMEFHILIDSVFEIHEYTATAFARTAFAYGRVKSHTESAEKRCSVGKSVVGLDNIVLGYYFERTIYVDRNSHVSS